MHIIYNIIPNCDGKTNEPSEQCKTNIFNPFFGI